MAPDAGGPSEAQQIAGDGIYTGAQTGAGKRLDEHSAEHDAAERRFEEALEQVAHGATVSILAILIEQGLILAFTALLTNGFAAGTYGLFVLARRFQEYLRNLTSSLTAGLSRFLPTAASRDERNGITSFASVLILGLATIFGLGLFITAPIMANVVDQGQQFRQFVRVFAIGLPVGTLYVVATEILRALEEITALNLTLRIGFPSVQLVVGGVLMFVFQDLLLVAGGVVLSWGLVGGGAIFWLIGRRGLRPHVSGIGKAQVHHRYLRFTGPLFCSKFVTMAQRYGFYPLIAFFLSGVAGGVFVVGVIVGSLVKLPLLGVNQFIPPVVATLHEQNHTDAIRELYQVTTRLIMVGSTAIAVPLIVYRSAVMGAFNPALVKYAPLLPAFIGGQYVASAAGSVGFLLKMTDHQRAVLVVNTALTAGFVVTAIPLTVLFGLPGVVVSFFLMLTVNNVLEVATFYYLEGLQPFTRLHAKPLIGAVPLFLVARGSRMLLPAGIAPLVGSLAGLVAYAAALFILGFTPVERQLLLSLLARYRPIRVPFTPDRLRFPFRSSGSFAPVGVVCLTIGTGLMQVIASGPTSPIGGIGVLVIVIGTGFLVVLVRM